MRVLSSSIFHGNNIYHDRSVIENEVDLGAFAYLTSAQAGPEFAENYIKRFCSLKTRVTHSYGRMPEAFLDHLRSADGALFSDVIFYACLALEDSMDFFMRHRYGDRFSIILAVDLPHRIRLIWRTRMPAISRRIIAVAICGISELLPDAMRQHFDADESHFTRRYRLLRTSASKRRFSPTTSLIAHAADFRGVPCHRLENSLIRLGDGCFQRYISAASTDKTTWLGFRLSGKKQITSRLLRESHLPVPAQRKVRTLKRALAAAESIGYPIVLKPVRGRKGEGVTAGLTSPADVEAAFRRASRANRYNSSVLVESFVEGDDHRILVFAGRVIAVAKRLPPSITGDGKSTVQQLIKQLNSIPKRPELPRCHISDDEELQRILKDADYSRATILPENTTLALRSTANLSTGGYSVDATEKIHPDNVEMAIRAVQIMRLDIGGVDFLTPDISRSYKEVGGIVEVNARPGLRPHTYPAEGSPRDVAGTMVDMLFPEETNRGHVPTVVVAGHQGASRITHLADILLRSRGPNSGRVTRKNAFINGSPAGVGTVGFNRQFRSILQDIRLDTLVCAISPRRIATRGLGFDQCDVAVVTDVEVEKGRDSYRHGIEVLLRAARGDVIINAADAAAISVFPDIDMERIVMVSAAADSAEALQHLESGGRVVTVQDEGQKIVFLKENRVIHSLLTPNPNKILDRTDLRDIRPILFAVAVVFALGHLDNQAVICS